MGIAQRIKYAISGNYYWVIMVVLGIILIVVHGFWNELFLVDSFTVIILLIISIPFLSHLIKRAKVPGAEFEFREEIENTKKIVQESVEKAKASANGKRKQTKFETFDLYTARRMLRSDPVLALASLRIEIEKKLI